MSKLPNRLAKLHQTALALLAQESLTVDQKWEVFERYQEGATNLNGLNGAFFTPMGLARDFGLNVGPCKRIIDLCAGIGALSFFHSASYRYWPGQTSPEIVCVEFNPEYLAAGRKLIPEATWIEASVLDLPDLGHFDVAISNPPFGRKGQPGSNKRYKGPDFEYRVIDIASDIADHGVFIVPTGSAPFEEGGRNYRTSEKYERFARTTGIYLDNGISIDTSIYREDWHGVGPTVEIVCADFKEARQRRPPAQRSLFEMVA